MRTLLRSTLVFACVLGACGDPAAPDRDSSLDFLLGEWSLIRTCGGIAPQCFESDGNDWIAFTPQDSMIAFADGARVWAFEARLVDGAQTPYGSHPSIEIWSVAEAEWQALYSVLQHSADSLDLSDNMADGYTMHLERR